MCYEDISDVLPVDVDVPEVDDHVMMSEPSPRDPMEMVICLESLEWLEDLVHDELMLL